MSKYILIAVLALGLLGGLSGLAGLALFTDTATVGANTFGTGNVDIATAPTTALITFTDMVPGDTDTGDLVVSNAGDLELRYAISSSATNADALALKDALTLTIKTIDVTTPVTPCNDFDGTQLYTGDLDDGAGGLLVGDPAQGADTGDRVLVASTSETLCFQVQLPSAATGPEGAATTATFTFDAEQTVNNP
jgi:predicted ribosomally synthesized peptide with SipW-like signal peptide